MANKTLKIRGYEVTDTNGHHVAYFQNKEHAQQEASAKNGRWERCEKDIVVWENYHEYKAHDPIRKMATKLHTLNLSREDKVILSMKLREELDDGH